jgi:hypothetical protein
MPFNLKFRPFSEFLQLDRFSIPANNDVAARLQVNLNYYQVNYAAIVLVVLLFAWYGIGI